jgi:hypothetical protein
MTLAFFLTIGGMGIALAICAVIDCIRDIRDCRDSVRKRVPHERKLKGLDK